VRHTGDGAAHAALARGAKGHVDTVVEVAEPEEVVELLRHVELPPAVRSFGWERSTRVRDVAETGRAASAHHRVGIEQRVWALPKLCIPAEAHELQHVGEVAVALGDALGPRGEV